MHLLFKIPQQKLRTSRILWVYKTLKSTFSLFLQQAGYESMDYPNHTQSPAHSGSEFRGQNHNSYQGAQSWHQPHSQFIPPGPPRMHWPPHPMVSLFYSQTRTVYYWPWPIFCAYVTSSIFHGLAGNFGWWACRLLGILAYTAGAELLRLPVLRLPASRNYMRTPRHSRLHS